MQYNNLLEYYSKLSEEQENLTRQINNPAGKDVKKLGKVLQKVIHTKNRVAELIETQEIEMNILDRKDDGEFF